MIKNIRVFVVTTFLSLIIFTSVSASVIGTTSNVADSSSYFTHYQYLGTTNTGRGGTAHKHTLSGNFYAGPYWGKWSSFGSTTTSTNYKWYVWIPENYGYTDAAVNYYVRNDEEEFTITVNQETKVDEWAFLGWAYGRGTVSPSYSYTYLTNGCVTGWGCNTSYEVWYDDEAYYPCSQHPSVENGDCRPTFIP